MLARLSTPSPLVREREGGGRERKSEGERENEEFLVCGSAYACKGAYTLFNGQRDRER